MLAMMQISRKLDMEDPTIVLYIRIAYVASTLITFVIYQLTKQKILKKNDKSTLKYVVPGNALTGEAERLEVTTVKDYDLKEITTAINGIYSGLAMMGFMHLYMKFTNPLFMQLISPVKGAIEHNEVMIHLWNKPATGLLKRPFKAESFFSSLSQAAGKNSNPAADSKHNGKKDIADMELAGTGGKKNK